MTASPINVNLVSGRAFELKKERATKTKVQFISAFVLVCFLGFLVIILGISTVVNVRLKQLQASAAGEEDKIKQLAFVEDTYLILQNKVALLEDFFGTNKDVLDGLDYLTGNLPEEIIISNISLDNQLKLISISLEASTYKDLNNFLDFALNNIDEKRFSKIDFERISRDETGKYNSTITLAYSQ